jgi:tight adherence protein B
MSATSLAFLEGASSFTWALLAGGATVLVVLALRAPIQGWVERRRERAQRFQRQLRLDRPLAMAVVGGPILGLTVLALAFAAGVWPLGLVAGLVIWRGLDSMSATLVDRRRRRFDAQLVDGLVGLANSLRAGMSLPQAVEQVAKDMPAPLSQEFAQIHQEYSLGKPIEQAFEDTRDRVRSRNFDLAVSAFKVGKERGGNVAEVFEKIAASVREIYRLEEHIRTVSTQGRSSARFMSLMPAVFLVLLYGMDSEGTLSLFREPVGLVVLTVVLVFNVIGHLWIRRILAVDV